MNMHKVIGDEFPEYLAYQQQIIYNILEDIYSVESESELQEAIDTIGTGSGTIFIEAGNHTISTTIDIDNNGSLVIYGHGDNTKLTTVGNISCFNITSARSVLFQNFKIDASSLTTATKEIIDITEASDNPVVIERITITGDGTNGYGIELNSENCTVKNCKIDGVSRGIHVLANENIIEKNIVESCNGSGIFLTSDYNTISNNITKSNEDGIHLQTGAEHNTITGNVSILNNTEGIYCRTGYNAISNNNCYNNGRAGIQITSGATYNTVSGNNCCGNALDGIYIGNASHNSISGNNCSVNNLNSGLSGAGISVESDSDNNTITGNTCNDNVNAGIGTAVGIDILQANCDENTVMANTALGNDTNFNDNGTNTFGNGTLNNFA